MMPSKGKDFYSNLRTTGISVGFMLVQALQARDIEGIRIEDRATDVYGHEMPDYKAVFMSQEAQRAHKQVYNSPEMAILRDATDGMFHARPGIELQFDIPKAIPGFFSEKNRKRLRALAWDLHAKQLQEFVSPGSSQRWAKSTQDALAKRTAILSPNWLGLSLPVKREVAVMVERVIAARLPESAQEAA
jgi:hypothetical protein